MSATTVPSATSPPAFPCLKGAALGDRVGGSYRQRQPLGKLRGPVTPPPGVRFPSVDEFNRLLDEFGKGLDLPALPADFSREHIYDDHD